MTQAALIVSPNPLVAPLEPVEAPVGVPIGSLCPKVRTPVVCRYNGQWILRKDWERVTLPGDCVEFYVQPAGKGALRTLLQIAVMVVAYTIAGPAGAGFTAGTWQFTATVVAVNLIGNALINTMLPLTPAGGASGAATSPTYNVGLQANQARLDSPIPVAYGYNKLFPNLAGQPYVHHDSKGDQYYHALLVIGHGEFEIIRTLIDDTIIDHFSDLRYKYLGPGEAPSAMTLPSGYTSTVNARTVSAEEVVGLDMLTAKPLGPFAACAPKQRVQTLHLDMGSPALGIASGSSMSNRTVEWRVDYRPIDDFGLPAGEYVTLGTQTLTAASAGAVRRSYSYTLPVAARVEVQVTRLDVKSDDTSDYDDLAWIGLRAEITDPAPLCPTASHLQVIIRANEQLSSLTQRKIATIATRKLRMWSPVDGWSPPVPTRNPAWALADKWTNSVYGDGLPEERIDLGTLYEKSRVWEARQDRFDHVFDTDTDSNSADQLIAKAGRAAVFTWYGMRTLARDEQEPLPRRAFTGRNITENDWSFSYTMPARDMPDGLILEYIDNRSWKPTTVECPMPGVSLPMQNPQRIRLQGVTGEQHARREGAYYAAALLYRRGTARWQTEMEGALLTYNASVRYAPPMPRWASGGDIVSWDLSALTAGLSEEVPLDDGVIVLIDHLGRAGAPISFTKVGARSITLATDPEVGIITLATDRERTRYLLGSTQEVARTVRVRRVEPSPKKFGEARRFEVMGIIEDDRVHTADADFLPVGNEVQDPVDDGLTVVSGEGTGGTIINLNNGNVEFNSIQSSALGVVAAVKLASTGQLWHIKGDSTYGISSTAVPAQWAIGSPGADYEVYVELLSGALRSDSTAVGTWLSLSVDRVWYLDDTTPAEASDASLRITIRKVGGAVQDTADYRLAVTTYNPGGGA